MSAEKYVRKIRTVIPLEHDWGTVLQKLVLEAAGDLARHQKPCDGSSDHETMDLKIPVTIYFDFPMIADAGAGDAGGPRCICIFKQYPDGGSVCICTGPGAADCDCEPVGGPIVA